MCWAILASTAAGAARFRPPPSSRIVLNTGKHRSRIRVPSLSCLDVEFVPGADLWPLNTRRRGRTSVLPRVVDITSPTKTRPIAPRGLLFYLRARTCFQLSLGLSMLGRVLADDPSAPAHASHPNDRIGEEHHPSHNVDGTLPGRPVGPSE